MEEIRLTSWAWYFIPYLLPKFIGIMMAVETNHLLNHSATLPQPPWSVLQPQCALQWSSAPQKPVLFVMWWMNLAMKIWRTSEQCMVYGFYTQLRTKNMGTYSYIHIYIYIYYVANTLINSHISTAISVTSASYFSSCSRHTVLQRSVKIVTMESIDSVSQ